MKSFKHYLRESADYPTSLAKNEEISSDLPEIYLDMDGVLVDWQKGADDALRKAGKPEWDNPYWKQTYGESATMKRWEILNAVSGFWENLEVLGEGAKLWKFVKQYKPNILSACSSETKNCKSGKLKWINKHLGTKNLNNIHLVRRQDKKNYAVNSNNKPTILIDDYLKNCQEFKNAGGIAIQMITANDVIAKLKRLGFK